MKVIKSLENIGILVKGTTRKINSQEEGFIYFFIPLMSAGLPLMKIVFTPLTKTLLIPFGLTSAELPQCPPRWVPPPIFKKFWLYPFLSHPLLLEILSSPLPVFTEPPPKFKKVISSVLKLSNFCS